LKGLFSSKNSMHY